MSRTPGNSDDDPDISVVIEPSGPTPPRFDDSGGAQVEIPVDVDSSPTSTDALGDSPARDGELFARDVQAAGDAGEGRRADALVCAQALLAERRGDDQDALGLWQSAFGRDPTLLVAFWGLRRALCRRGAWDDLLGIVDRRIAVVLAPDREAERADLWLERGRILEDRLGRDPDAAHSYRAGLIEVPDHPGLLISLLLLGWRRLDRSITAEALAGLLLRPLPSALRALLAVALARLERAGFEPVPGANAGTEIGTQIGTEIGSVGPEVGSQARLGSVDPVTAARALEILSSALRVVGPGQARPLLDELSLLARATTDPATRVEILGELASGVMSAGSVLSTTTDANATPKTDTGLAVALLRERARLLRDSLGDRSGATEALRSALSLCPRHPIVIAELADLIEAGTSVEGPVDDQVIAGLRDLLDQLVPVERPYETEVETSLALRHLTALARAGRTSEGLELLDRHPELSRDRDDGFALEVVLRAAAGDSPGLAVAFERLGEGRARAARGDPAAAAHALVVAGTLRERGKGAGPPDAVVNPEPTRLYRRAAEIAPGYRPARSAVERRLWGQSQWRDLALVWESELERLRGAAGADTDLVGRLERGRLLEELVALHRDVLANLDAASGYQDQILALGDADVRAWVRRFDLELATVARGGRQNHELSFRVLRELGARAGSAGLSAGLLVEAGRAAVAAGDAVAAESLFHRARPDDRTGGAWAGLERLAGSGGALAKAEIVRAEVAGLAAGLAAGIATEDGALAAASAARLRDLRFRVAWHAQAKLPSGALEALEPLRAAGDPLAWSWSWEIARRSGDPTLEVSVLESAPEGPAAAMLEVSSDLGEALERVGDLAAAQGAFREALRQAPSTEAALGLLRVGSVLGSATVVLEATRHLLACADEATRPLLSQEVAMLTLVGGATHDQGPAVPLPDETGDDGLDAVGVVLRWAAGVRSGEVIGAAAGLLAMARAVPTTGSPDALADRNGLLARAAARARFGGTTLAGAVHDQVHALSEGAAPIGVGLADLPVAGRPERVAARIARAERNGGRLGYALDIERGLDAEARGDRAGALDGFARALSRDAEGLEALDGIKRLARVTGDRLGAARAGMRLGAVLRAPARAAAEFGMAGQTWEDLGLTAEAGVAYWHALARDPGSEWIYERLRAVLGARHDDAGLDRLYGHRLAVLAEARARADLLLERGAHRLGRLGVRKAAIDDFKRVLKLAPDHAVALRYLASLATQMEYFPQACRYLERLLAREIDETVAASLRLELGAAYEAARDPARAVETLRRATLARPRDSAPWQRLADLLLRIGDWPNALASLRSWEAALGDPARKAEIWIRIGCLLRDHARDGAAATAAFVTAADLDPLGDGIPELVAHHERSGAVAARRDALDDAIAGLRAALMEDPLDLPRLRRLRDLYVLCGSGPAPDRDPADALGAVVTGQLLALCGEGVTLTLPQDFGPRGTWGPLFWQRLTLPGALGFASELWPTLAVAATELFPAVVTRPSQRERIAPGSEPRLAWIAAAAVAVGLPPLQLSLSRGGDPSDGSVIPIDGPQPELLVGPAVLSGDPASRFRVGRALGLLRDRAVVFERMSVGELGTLLAAAAVLAGAPSPVGGRALKSVEEHAKLLGKSLSRKDRKALELEASRFSFESIDAALFRESVLANADRLGLVLANDVEAAVRVIGGFDAAAVPAGVIAADRRARDLIRFALSEDFLTLGRDREMAEG